MRRLKCGVTLLLLTLAVLNVNAIPNETKVLETEITSFSELDNGVSALINIGFDFDFYGQSYSQFSVTTDGLLLLGHNTTGQNGFSNVAIPNSDSPNGFIAPFWDNLKVSDGPATPLASYFDGQSKVSYAIYGASPTRKLIVQWTNMLFNDDSPMGTFQAILYEGSNKIQTQYRLLVDKSSNHNFGQSATIGIENQDGSKGVQYSHHQNLLSNQKAISYTPKNAGEDYDLESNAIYEPVVLTQNLSLPEPGIPYQGTPAHEALVPTSVKLSWTPVQNVTKYRLIYSTVASRMYSLSGLSTVVDITDGSTSHTVDNLSVGQKYYWAVMAENATGTTWSQVYAFEASNTPPLVAVPSTNYVAQNKERTIMLHYTGGDESGKVCTIESLPAEGKLYQYDHGVKGAEITAAPTVVSDSSYRVIYEASGNYGNGVGDFEFGFKDDTYALVKETAQVHVSPPGVPNFVDGAKTTNTIEVTFDIPMADPTGTHGEFAVKEVLADSSENSLTVTSIAAKNNDPYTYILTLASPISATAVDVYTKYTKGTVISAEGGVLESFDFQLTEKVAQTITFPNPGDRVYGSQAFVGGATASSGLTVTYSSSDPSICSVSGSSLVPGNVGTVTITATQIGNENYAPVYAVQTFNITKASAPVTLSNLLHTYDGSGKSATVSTVPSGLKTTVTYDGSTTLPVNAGSYTVTATIVDDNYQGATTKTLTINKALAVVNISNLVHTYDGSQKQVVVSTTPSGLTTTVTYDGSSTAPSAVGQYAVRAEVVDNNYDGVSSETMVIEKDTPTAAINMTFYKDGHTLVWNVNGEEEAEGFTVYKVVDGEQILFDSVVADGEEYKLDISGVEADSWVLEVKVKGQTSVKLNSADKNKVATTLFIEKGWNLLGVSGRQQVISTLKAGGYSEFWVWRGEAYRKASSIADNEGFWVYSPEKKTLRMVTDKVVNAPAQQFPVGWSLRSFASDQAEELNVVSAFHYLDGAYKRVTGEDKLKLLGGYWVFSAGE